MTNYQDLIDRLIDLAIEEDISTGDISTNAIIPVYTRATAEMKAKASGVVSGMGVIRAVYERFEKDIVWEPLVQDGDWVEPGDILLRMEASYRCLLCGERLSLNILQRMSGIATETAKYVRALEGTKTRLLDTRKTAPGMRVLDKLAVKHGGGMNHRMGLYDMVMLKDNHIKIAGGIPQAIAAVKRNQPLSVRLEVETTNLEEVRQALEGGADIIMLDNMDNASMAEAVRLIAGRAKTEASGNMSLERMRSVAEVGVDYISVGALTHSVKAMDISMNIKILK
ncbi:MAG: carboxylating nicotinate-nucleotide diphosphorylase [Bacteroidales bacterium]|nr:carboxylating nicotinate-nucleotide diphosphorylase [Bacteroidales bacterium]